MKKICEESSTTKKELVAHKANLSGKFNEIHWRLFYSKAITANTGNYSEHQAVVAIIKRED